jgi:hypothetical protein
MRAGVNGIQGPSAYPLWQWFCQNGKTDGAVDKRRQSFSLACRARFRMRPDGALRREFNILRNTKYPTRLLYCQQLEPSQFNRFENGIKNDISL